MLSLLVLLLVTQPMADLAMLQAVLVHYSLPWWRLAAQVSESLREAALLGAAFLAPVS